MGLKICVVTNYYPPFFIGGYELGCRDIVEALKSRGHQVKVLTSTYGLDNPQTDGEVYRWLQLSQWWTPNILRDLSAVLQKDLYNQKAFRKICSDFGPDLIYMWNPVGISLSIVSIAQELNVPVCYFVSDHWVKEWENDPGYRMWGKQRLGLRRPLLWKGLLTLLNSLKLVSRPLPPDLSHVQFASDWLKRDTLQKERAVANAEVIHWGVNLEHFRVDDKPEQLQRLLFVGQVTHHKGVHTAVEALNLLVERGYESATLTIVGDSALSDFKAQLKARISSRGLERNVRFVGLVQRESMPSIYSQHDILIFPSVWEEPFSIALLEAMASGVAVVGTATGGSSEILQDGINALVFEKENADECATCISRLFNNKDLFDNVRRQARLTIERKYRLEQMVDAIEKSLTQAVARSGPLNTSAMELSNYETAGRVGISD